VYDNNVTDVFSPRNPVRDVAILLMPGFSNLCLATAVEPLRAANQLAGEALYRWRLLSLDGASVRTSSYMEINVAGTFTGREPAEALFVIAAAHYADQASRPVCAALRRTASRTRCLGGLDTGSHLLAAAGLLDGHRATIHWEEFDTFAETFPEVDASRDRYVIDGNRITAGGATTVLDLMLDIIGRQDGMALALAVAGRFIYDPEGGKAASDGARPQQAVPLELIARTDQALSAAVATMDAHLEDPLPIERVAKSAGIGLRDLERRFHRHLGTPPGAYYRSLRLALVRRLIEETELSVAEIAARSGFASASALARAFRGRYGVSPRQLRSSYSASGPFPLWRGKSSSM
jgi:transcriptional regulator GlxA family with amidase domain